jgi:hypothetical protein
LIGILDDVPGFRAGRFKGFSWYMLVEIIDDVPGFSAGRFNGFYWMF